MYRRNSFSTGRFIFGVICLFLLVTGVQAFEGFLTITNGYYADTVTGEAFLPHGIAYQTWNRPLGVWQSHEQIDYDLDEMVKMGANSVRIDMVWQHIEEDGDNQYKWENYDYLVQACEERELRIFALIGYQWPPNWFPDEWYTKHPPEWDAEGIWHSERWLSDIINYEHPDARFQYAEWLGAVAGRYKDAKAIAGWIVGNESGYLGLWSGLLDGYDDWSEAAFRIWCSNKYETVENVNTAWGSTFTAFTNIVFVEQYRAYGVEGAEWADMVQWREDSIASFTAVGAVGCKQADTNHLISYSTVGMQWGEEDWRYHAEDRGKITAVCAQSNAPIDFFSVNNYPWSVLGHESQNGHWGISFTKKVSGVPALYSETGFTSSETMWPGMDIYRQGPLIRNSLWESLEAGAIGTHVFSWMDRPYITDREKGFGIVYADRSIKPAFWTTRNSFNLMAQVELKDMLMASEDPVPDIAFLWTDANDSQYNRYECEMQQIAGALERLGYEPYFMDLNDMAAGDYLNYKLIILPRNMRVEDEVPGTGGTTVLDFLRTVVIPAGVHVMATADLPGMQNPLGRPRPEFPAEMDALFGIDVTDIGGFEAPQRRNEYVSWFWKLIVVDFNTNSSIDGYHCWPQIWKYSDEIEVSDGTVWATMDSNRNKSFEDNNTIAVKWDYTGEVHVRNGWGWAYDGNNMVQMWGDAGLSNDFAIVPFGRYTHGTYFRSNAGDALRDGAEAFVAIEWYDEEGNILGTNESAHLTSDTGDAWIRYEVDVTAPAEAYTARRIIRIQGPGEGSLFVDDRQLSPAVVVKDHGAAKSAIFLFSAGDQKPDGDLDGDPDVYPWQWRFDYFGAVIKDYFGVQPKVEVTGSNAYLCLPEYRTAADGSTIWQIKNYMYEPNTTNGGDPLTFTISSDLFLGKTVKGWEQAKIYESPSDGTIEITLDPDGHEMLHVYDPVVNDYVVQLADAPALVHPFGDKIYNVVVKYDTLGSNLVVKMALREKGDNGDGVTNEIIQVVTTNVTGQGTLDLQLYVPDFDSTDTDFISTMDGGAYEIVTWIEDASSNRLTEVAAQGTQLDWGVRPTETLPTTLDKGDTFDLGYEWEELYEPLYWQNTPMVRGDAFASRVAVYRSTKTEAFYPGHLDRANAVCDWLETMGYESGNPLDLTFDNLLISSMDASGAPVSSDVFTDDMEAGTNGWTASGLWHQDTAISVSTSHSWGYNNGVDYDTGATTVGALISPWIDLSDASGATLTFNSWYETEDQGTSWDRKILYISTDGVHWTELMRVSGVNKAWVPQVQHLAAYVGQQIQLKFEFNSVDAIYNSFQGWFIDDVCVSKKVATTQYALFDDVESGVNGWTAEGLWRLADDRSASATHSWAFNDGTDYDTGGRAQGGLISPWIDLSNALSASLSFQSWFHTEDTGAVYDRKQVYVSTDEVTWVKVHQVAGAAEQWTDQICDLSAYAGSAIRIKFEFDSVDALSNTFPGWYVDDIQVSVEQGSSAAFFADDVEAGVQDWTSSGLWHIDTIHSASTSHSWTFNNGTDYNTGGVASGELISPLLDLSAAEGAILTFNSWYETEDTGTSWDKKLVYVTEDDVNWIQILQISGENSAWVPKVCDLSAFVGGPIRVKFVFNSVDAVYNNFQGWFIDDIAVEISGSGMLFADSFEDGNMDDWQWVAGAANWEVDPQNRLRAWRIGNHDNIILNGDTNWSDYVAEVDVNYNQFGYYNNDAELYVRYQDRNNFYRLGIHNYYSFWRLKYTVMVDGEIEDQGWLHSFAKTNRPVENTTYRLKAEVEGTNVTVYFDGELASSFSATNFSTGCIALGSRASQLGIWEPPKGYFFIDDDEYGMTGDPLNLDWGYLKQFFGTLILPGVYVMNDTEVENIDTWLTSGLFSLISTDGGAAMKDETNSDDLGRIEHLFGVHPVVLSQSGLQHLTVTDNDHYITHDYQNDDQFDITSGTCRAWTEIDSAQALGLIDNGTLAYPALVANLQTTLPDAPAKTCSFNFDVAAEGRLTNECALLARRAFEWARGNAHKVKVELKYQVAGGTPDGDLTLRTWEEWVLGGTGTNSLQIDIPDDNIMTGDNLYWVMTVFPWQATNAWLAHNGFYTSGNDDDGAGVYTSLSGIGLQILGATDMAYGGHIWDVWVAYNTRGEDLDVVCGLKEKGDLLDADNFNDTNYTGWTVYPAGSTQWVVTNDVLAYETPYGGCSVITRDGLNVSNRNVTIEYDVRYDGATEGGGFLYRGQYLQLNREKIVWSNDDPLDFSSGTSSNFSGLVTNADGSVSYVVTGSIGGIYIGPPGLSTGEWHHIVISIRDGDTNLMSDVIVDGNAQYMGVMLRQTNFTSSTVGFVGPYTNGIMQIENFHIVDEEYSYYTETVNGEFVPTNAAQPTFWIAAPDYDPQMWEYEGTTLGGEYEWYSYFAGTEIKAAQDVGLYFAPRLCVEATNFPVVVDKAETVTVPVDWENLPNVPVQLRIGLEYPYQHQWQDAGTYAEGFFTIYDATGSGEFEITIPSDTPAGSDYLWSAYIFEIGEPDPYAGRLGLDDTFRFDANGPVIWNKRETIITVTSMTASSEEFRVFSDAGIPVGTDIMVWGDDYFVPITTPTNYDGGFEASTANGAFPDGGYWQPLSPGGGANAICVTTAARTPNNGLWIYTGWDTWANWCAPYQEFVAVEGDVFRGEIYARQPAGEGWVAGSEAFARMKYLSAASNEISYVDSPLKVTTAGQGWTLCSITNAPPAPQNTAYMRMEVIITKPGQTEVSVANFDDCTISYGNSFYGNYTGEGVDTPEGSKCFRSSVINWSGWGVFYDAVTYSNGVDWSEYTNGYLKFWLKTPGSTRVEISDVDGNKQGYPSSFTWYPPTTNASGDVVWEEKTIPLSHFDQVDFSRLSSPFMGTDPISNAVFTFLIDDVRWTLDP